MSSKDTLAVHVLLGAAETHLTWMMAGVIQKQLPKTRTNSCNLHHSTEQPYLGTTSLGCVRQPLDAGHKHCWRQPG